MHNNDEFQFQYSEPHQSLGPTKNTSVPVETNSTEAQLIQTQPNWAHKNRAGIMDMDGKLLSGPGHKNGEARINQSL